MSVVPSGPLATSVGPRSAKLVQGGIVLRKLLLFGWLLVPAVAGAWHYGPGQDALRADRAASAAARGVAAARLAERTAAAEGDLAAKTHWAAAEAAFGEALEQLPGGRVAEARALRLERAKARMFLSGLPDARRELEALVDELAEDPAADPQLLADARAALGNAQYYTTWLMRLEGAPREEWEPEIEAARQNFKLLAEQAQAHSDAQRLAAARHDVESAIRLMRMDLDELQGLPLPSQ